ncbi:RepB family plasmid replication initiator protein [Helicobacter apodemus]|uniref:RepB family plasmid replication initiator protein n=1 Tax=Helicobacter apodemus TaxID=135569 RepID=A0A4U8UDQ0_9HELI|nr:replication initiation protein [Helicobacter apodemus]TLE13254.1 RepB family plasmid replication initiator protein [Helicobacter apodemus]
MQNSDKKKQEVNDNGFTINKHNEFIKVQMIKRQMTLTQAKLFDSIIATIQYLIKNDQIDASMELQEDRILRIDYNLFYSCMLDGVSKKRINKKEIAQGLDDLVSITYKWMTKTGFGSASIFTRAEIDYTTNEVIIQLGKDFNKARVIPQQEYTKMLCGNLNMLRSIHSRILYQYLKMLLGSNTEKAFKNTIYLSLESIQRIFSLNKKDHQSYFSQPNILVKRCIKEPIQEINKNDSLDIVVNFELKKNKNKTIGVTLFFHHKKTNYDSEYLKSDFNQFKKQVIEKYKGKSVIQGVLNYSLETTFSINQNSLIVNNTTQKVLSSDEAYHIWSFMYKNQSLIGKFFSHKELLLKEYKSKTFLMNNELFTLVDIEDGDIEDTFTLVLENNEKTIGRIKSMSKEQIKGLQWQ